MGDESRGKPTVAKLSGMVLLTMLGIAAMLLFTSALTPAGQTAAAPNDTKQRRPRVEHFKSVRLAKPLTQIRVNNGKPDYLYSTLYSIKLPELKVGDVVQAHAQFEATNDAYRDRDAPLTTVMFAHAMLLHDKETIYDHSEAKPTDPVVCDYSGENITKDMHHGFRTLVGSFQAERAGDAWLSVIVYAAHVKADPKKNMLRIEGNWPKQSTHGDLRAIVFRND